MKLDQFAQMRGFQQAHQTGNHQALDMLLNTAQGDEIREKILTKRLQFDCAPHLYSEVESICGLLDCSKREFLEMAVSEAIAQAQKTFMESFKAAHGQEFMDVHGVKV
jgi:hypothetical protein